MEREEGAQPIRKTTEKNYVLVHVPGHREADRDGFVREHRYVAERRLGRPLEPGEVVHHRDKRPWNNADENLLVCPSQDLHLMLHRAMDEEKALLVAECERWFEQLAAEKHRPEDRRSQTPPAIRHERPAASLPAVAPAASGRPAPIPVEPPATAAVVSSAIDSMDSLLAVVSRIAAIANKEERAGYLRPVLDVVSPERLLPVMLSRIETSAPGVVVARLTWTLGVLDVESAGPALLNLLQRSQDDEQRRLIWSALKKRHYPALDTDQLRRLAVDSRGQSLLYAIGAIAVQCIPDDALSTLAAIEQIGDAGYSPSQIAKSLRAGREKIGKVARSRGRSRAAAPPEERNVD